MNPYQPIAASAVEVCTVATLIEKSKTHKLATYIVDQTALLISKMVDVPLCPEMLEALDLFEQKVDAIRRHMEQTGSVRAGKRFKAQLGSNTGREISAMKAELETLLKTLLSLAGKSPAPSVVARNESILELVSLSTRVAGAICDVPVLNFLKPMVGIAALICDTAKSVQCNREASLDLAKHASIVTKCVVERASALDGELSASNVEAVKTLELTLEDIHSYLIILGKRPKSIVSWILANQDRDRIYKLNSALDKALAMFLAANSLSMASEVCSNTRKVAILVSAVKTLDGNLNRTLTMMHIDRAPNWRIEGGKPNPGCVPRNDKITAFVPLFSHFTALPFVFLDPLFPD
ncbi:hypothetical protein B0H13DRAFT_1941807 [Mycena leptocephala]|nr:hypothetical protein B0H13DRAFT_1941807 [Mycena leptocephala]